MMDIVCWIKLFTHNNYCKNRTHSVTSRMNTKCLDVNHNSCTVAWNPFSLGKLGPDAWCPDDSAMSKIFLFYRGWFKNDSKSNFMRLIMLNNTVGTCTALRNTLLCCALINPPAARLSFSHWTSFLHCLLLFHLLCSKHSPPLSPSFWKIWVMDLGGGMSAKNGNNRTSVITPNIYISSFVFLFFPSSLFPLSSFVGVQLMADWTLVMPVCCCLRDEAPIRLLTCESLKVSLLTLLNTKK